VWIIIAAGIVATVIVGVGVARLRSTNEFQFGWVTEAWLAEYRGDQGTDST
jgi:hypothetical protein